jgi:hypothetical protein
LTQWAHRRRWLQNGRVARRSRGPLLGGLSLRCVVWWRARELDRQLAAGVDPLQSDELSLRAGQLGSARNRRRVACALRGAVELAERDVYPVAMAPYPVAVAAHPIRRAAVRANRELLLEIAERLCRCDPVGVRGLAMTSRLVDDRRAPLYRDNADRPLPVAAFEALVALDRGPLTISVPES